MGYNVVVRKVSIRAIVDCTDLVWTVDGSKLPAFKIEKNRIAVKVIKRNRPSQD